MNTGTLSPIAARPSRSRGPLAGTLLAVVVGVATAPAGAEVRVPALVGSHMVLQRDAPARIWGWADPGEGVRVAVAEASAEARADGDGRWAVDLAPQPTGGPYRLTIAGDNTLTFEDVWLGEVWVASGQSNMEWPLSRSEGGDAAAAAGCEGLRLFTVARATSLTPRDDVGGEWAACDEATAPSFSAVAFHFGQELHRRLGTRVGLIHSSWGGTPAEAWTSREALDAQPTLRPMVAGFDAALALNDPEAQKELAAKLEAWETANYHQDTGNEGLGRGWARPGFDSSGWKAMELPGQWEQAGLPIDGAAWFRRTVDIPAPWAGRDLILSLGAIDDFDTTYVAGEEIGGTGNETPGYWSVPRRYAVPGRLVKAGSTAIAVRVFDHYGNGGFDGATALVSSPAVPQPVALRYAWADNPVATLQNAEGLPASPFRTDDWPAITGPGEVSDGRDLVRAMHARYDGRWYRDFMLVQDVTYLGDGRAGDEERMTEYISLPGRVRAITGRVEDGNASIYVDGAFHRFEGGRAVGQVATVHGVLVTGFDVYTQDPERTIVQLEELGIDLDRITEAAWQGRPAWLVGARPDDPDTPQLWVEKERLLCVRVVSRRPSGVLDVEMGGYKPLGEGWIATELVFKRDGVAVLREDYAEFRTLDAIDPALFDVTSLKTTGPLP